jgi:D-alanyl-D-alanine carboxypeptidase
MYYRPLLFTPGTKFNYSNTNYFILGLLIEKLTRQPLADVIKNEITDPLGLANTYYVEHQPDPKLLSSLVHGYQNQAEFTQYIPRDSDVTQYSLSYIGPAGGLLSTTKDISKWTSKLFTPGMVLSNAQFKKLTTLISQSTGKPINQPGLNDPNAYGLGIGAIYDSQLHTSIYIYQGITFGCRAIYVYLPKTNTSIVIAANSSYSLDKNHLVNLINSIKQTIIH